VLDGCPAPQRDKEEPLREALRTNRKRGKSVLGSALYGRKGKTGAHEDTGSDRCRRLKAPWLSHKRKF
jgi:hypothetical protein